jgi:hypothetical protein
VFWVTGLSAFFSDLLLLTSDSLMGTITGGDMAGTLGVGFGSGKR